MIAWRRIRAGILLTLQLYAMAESDRFLFKGVRIDRNPRGLKRSTRVMKKLDRINKPWILPTSKLATNSHIRHLLSRPLRKVGT